MTTTVNTNAGALIALQNLNRTTKELGEVQTRINTGLRISSAKQDGGIYAISQRMRALVASYGAVQDSLNRGQSTAEVALAAGEAISDLLIELKEKALAAADSSIDTTSRIALNEDFKALRDQITNITDNAEFNGVNLINGSVTSLNVLANDDGSNTIRIGAEDLRLSGSIVTITSTSSFGTATQADAVASLATASLNAVNNALARLGTAIKSVEIQNVFVTRLTDQLEVGIGNLVDADLARDSARLQQLQVKQQLGTQALGIANAAPQTILSFFGG
jgi:flagellin